MATNGPFVKGNKAQVMVGLDGDQVAALDRLAARYRQSRSSLIRRAVAIFLAENTSETDTAAPSPRGKAA